MATIARSPDGGAGEEPERLTVAPIVGPDDPRRFTDSGIEVAELYT
jgi:methylmalonyl-CoA mutase, N-terminal domain